MDQKSRGRDLFIVDNSVSGWTGLRLNAQLPLMGVRYARFFGAQQGGRRKRP